MGLKEREREHPTYSLSTIIMQLFTASPPLLQLFPNSSFTLMQQQEPHRSSKVNGHMRITAGAKKTILCSWAESDEK